MYDIENYYQAESVKDAVRLLNEHPDARIISGGSDVLIKIREGKFAGTSLVSIHGIKEIQGVKMACGLGLRHCSQRLAIRFAGCKNGG